MIKRRARGSKKPILDFLKTLDLAEGIRSGLCMLPMLIAYSLGRSDVGVPLGQAGFLVSALPLTKLRIFRATNGIIFLTFGLGLYLIGGTVVFSYWAALIFTFIVSFALSFMSGWRVASLLAFTFFSVYSAGLNLSSPDALQKNFYAFSAAILWCSIISLLPFWKGIDMSRMKLPDLITEVKTGFRMGIGTTISLAISSAFTFSKLGWAPSATANVIRYEKEENLKRAKMRVIGTVAGAIGVGIFFILVPNINYWMFGAFILTIVNGLTSKINKWGYFPFYTTVILILYSLTDPTHATTVTIQRVAYNVAGVVVAYLVVVYSFPRLFNWIDSSKFAKMSEEIKAQSPKSN